MAELFVGPVMEKIIESCYDHLKDQFRWQTGMKRELKRLREIHPTIQAVVSSFSQAQIIQDSHLNEWLWKLRDAVDEADDVLDEIEYWKHEKHVTKSKKIRKLRFHLKSLKKRVVKIGKRAFKIDPTLKRLEEAVHKLDKIATEFSTFNHLLDGKSQEEEQRQKHMREARETGAMPTDNLLGRSKEAEYLRQWLSNIDQTENITNSTEDFYKNISLLSVVGDGGMGKTKLLQHIYDDGVTEGFGVKAWVCVSDNFDAKRVITDILEYITKKRPSLETLAALQKILESEVKSKRLLLVLDDVWEDDEEKWKKVLGPLSHGSPGSKILITTRMNSVALMFANIIEKSKEPLQLKGLEEAQCLQLLNKHAFAGIENPEAHNRLKSITEKMIKKLLGSPLAAKIIGGILNLKLDESYWTKILNTEIHNVHPGQNVLLPILKLSYIYLPKYLQNCFTFCGIFPQDHQFNKEDLVRMWIALSFIHSSNIEGETLEDTGGRYFDTLVRKSFFDEFELDGRVYYKMHDLMHELAQFVSAQEIFRIIDDKELSIPPTIRHLSIQTNNLEAAFKMMRECKNLRSLFLSFSKEAKYNENSMDALSEIFKASKNIHLLVVFAPSLKKIPDISDTISCLIHLRYLKLDLSRFYKLPRCVSHLYHLQFLIYTVSYDHQVKKYLSSEMNNLYNLRYLQLPGREASMVYEIGKLKFLQNLNDFYVKKENGYGIGELEHMNELREISICQLENITDAEEACNAKLCDKKNLTDLSLEWCSNRDIVIDHDLDEKVLDRIQPCNNLRRLIIKDYMGIRSAMWMNDVSFTSSFLEYIHLKRCLKWKSLPPFGQLPFLRSLYLDEMPEVEKLDFDKDCHFPSLEVLSICGMKALQEWFNTTVAVENGCLFPCLTKLRLGNCPKLQELPSLPTKLQDLVMFNIGWKSCNLLQGIRSCSSISIRDSLNLISLKGGWEKLKTNENCQLIIDELTIDDPSVLLVQPLRSVSSLRSLTIKKNDEFVQFPIETADQWFSQLCSSLFELKFNELHSLQSLPSSLKNLSSLNTLHVSNAASLKLLPELTSSLRELELCDVESLQWLPSFLSTFSSLKHLKLKNIPHLNSLLDLPSSLENLELEKLESCQCLPSSLSTFSSLKHLKLNNIPHLKSLPDLPSSVEKLELEKFESWQCLPSSLSTLSSLTYLNVNNIPHLKSLPDLPSSLKALLLEKLESFQCLPSSLSTLSSLRRLHLNNIPHLKSLPDLPSSLEALELERLESLQCQPSYLSDISALRLLKLNNIPHLESMPDLPSSLEYLSLQELENLDCLPELPASLKGLLIQDCHPQLRERYKNHPELYSSIKVLWNFSDVTCIGMTEKKQ